MTLVLLACLAAAPSPDAEREVQEAITAYRAFKVQKGLEALARALERPDLGAAERARVWGYVGIGEALRGDDAAAAKAFEQTLLYDPAATLPGETSPKIRAAFEQVRQRVVPPSAKPEREPPPPPPKVVEPPAAAAPPAAVEVPPAPAPQRHFGPVIVGSAVALAAVVSGAALGWHARSLETQANQSKWADERERLALRASRAATWANVLWAVGGGAALVGLVITLAW